MKTFQLTVFCECFAKIEVNAETQQEATEKAMQSHGDHFDVESHTLIPRSIETIAEKDK